MFMDIRYVMGNGMEAWGQEMGHGFGLDHSRLDGSDVDYQDPWDVMSTANAYFDVDPNYGHRGPGLNAWNMRGRKWLDESRIWKHGPGSPFAKNVVIRPLHRRDLSGDLGLELPGIGVGGPYLLEYRTRADWDSAIPRRRRSTIPAFIPSSWWKHSRRSSAGISVRCSPTPPNWRRIREFACNAVTSSP